MILEFSLQWILGLHILEIVVVNSSWPGRGIPKDTALQYDEGHKKVTSWESSFIDEKNDEVSDDTEGQHSRSVEYNEKERISLNYIIHKLLKITI
ncbi:unnamed protein product [Rhizophagus irregularis]|nr:unnamed protein product [Rhizophagus irregularis]CAB5355784.1 unnamed protein product [Rhizophagus irregularis]